MLRIFVLPLVLFALIPALSAAPAGQLAGISSKADLESALASTADAFAKQALTDDRAEILAAIEMHPHVEAVTRIVEEAHGKVAKINTTPENLKKIVGEDMPVFDTLKLVDLAVPNAGPHDVRKTDPYDAAFFEHLGHIATLESLNIISTKFNDDWIDSLIGLTKLKALRFTNNGKLTDAGLEKLAGLREMESFSFVGTGMKGHAFAKFEGWMHLTHCSFRGSSIDDEGLRQLCEHFPNLESISLAHAKFTDAGAPALAKLSKLKGFEIGTPNATAACLRNLATLPLDYLQLGEGFASPESIANIRDFKTLRRLTLTDCAKMTDADLQAVGAMKQLEHLELGDLPMPEERVAQLKTFDFLKSFRLVQRPQPYPEEIQAKIHALLPKVQLNFL